MKCLSVQVTAQRDADWNNAIDVYRVLETK